MATTDFTNNITLTDAAWFDDVDKAAYAYLTSTAGTNTITATGAATFSYATGAEVRFVAAGNNSGATTINITPSGGAALGAKNVYANGAACVGGEIVSGRPYILIYDGTQFNIVGSAASDTQGTFTATLTGCTTSPTATATYSKSNNVVTLHIPSLSATSNTTACTITGAPVEIRPTTAHQYIPCLTVDNGASAISGCDVETSGTITLRVGAAMNVVFTGSGTKGQLGMTITYNLN